jgi:predicted PurR-regulated permease PerM
MAALKPSVDLLEKFRVPRSIAIILIYIFLWTVVGGIIASLIPQLIDQTGKLLSTLPRALSNIDYLSSHQQEITTQLLAGVGSIPQSVFKVTIGFFGNILNVVTTIVISFYLLLERKSMNDKFTPQISKVINQIEHKLGGWIRGELFLMTAIGVLTYIGLRLLGLETALPLAILAAMLEIIPTIGPLISAIPAIIIALMIHPFLGVSVAALYFLIQFLENNLLVPQVMQKATGVSPLISILALMIGFRLAGTLGAVLSIPAVLVIQVIGPEFFSISHLEKLSE